MATDEYSGPATALRALLRREEVSFGALAVVALVGFGLTRTLASSNEAIRRADARAWHQRAVTALEAKDLPVALDAARRAARIDRDSIEVSILLAQALRASGEVDQAATGLGNLRATHPDDPDLNSELARLELARGDTTLAVRYYQDALDALWAPEVAERARTLRLEFIKMLLERGQRGRALSQILVLAANLPDDPQWELQTGELFLEAGDARRALDRYTTVLSAQPDNSAALIGAGRASFNLGDYVMARRQLAASESTDPEITSLREVATNMLTLDPLVTKLGAAERERRIQSLAKHAISRLEACATPEEEANPQRIAVQERLDALMKVDPRARRSSDGRDRAEDAVEISIEVEHLTAKCRPVDSIGRAVAIMARQHGLEAAS